VATRNDPLGDVLRPSVTPTPPVSPSRPRKAAFGPSRHQASRHDETKQPARRS
jgi:hypothetical protein